MANDDHPADAAEQLGDRLPAALAQRGDRVVAVIDRHLDPPGREPDHAVGEPGQEPDAEHAKAIPRELLPVDPEDGGDAAEDFTEGEERGEVECEHRPGRKRNLT